MIRDIFSEFFLSKLFSNIDEGKKLKLIKYNKSLQKTLKIDLIYYKIFSGAYIIYESNGKGRIYNRFQEIIYEGGLTKGERNGKGKEYKNILKTKLIYDGEYLNGKRNGNGKEYNEERIIYEGGFFRGERHGKGKEYDNFGNLVFDGEYFKGKKWKGKIKRYNNKVLKLEGEYLNGKLWNAKRYDSKHNIIYELKDGKGYIKEFNYDNKLVFEGEYLNGKINGKGKEYNSKGEITFEGEYFNGKRWSGQLKGDKFKLEKGKGYMSGYLDHSEFEFEEEPVNGVYILEFTNNENIEHIYKFESEYMNGVRHGKGKEYDVFGHIIFDGEFINGKKRKGKSYFKDEGILFIYEGEYINDKKNGEGKIYSLKYTFLEGKFLNGYLLRGKAYNLDNGYLKFNGSFFFHNEMTGKEYIDGILSYEGDYLYGVKWNGKGYDKNGNIIYELNNGNGYTKEYHRFSDILRYEGQFKYGEANGKGKEYDFDGKLIFEGEFLNGKRWNGYGFDWSSGFRGEYLNGKEWNGIFNEDEDNLKCELNNGKGLVKIKDFNRTKFEFEYLNGEKNGKARECDRDGNLVFDGEYLNEEKWKGKIKKYYKNKKLKFEYDIVNGLIWDGKEYDENGAIICELNNGNGKVKEYENIYDRLIFEGEYLDGKRNGKGKEYDFYGRLTFEGVYLKGKKWNGKGYEHNTNTIYELINGKGKIIEYNF